MANSKCAALITTKWILCALPACWFLLKEIIFISSPHPSPQSCEFGMRDILNIKKLKIEKKMNLLRIFYPRQKTQGCSYSLTGAMIAENKGRNQSHCHKERALPVLYLAFKNRRENGIAWIWANACCFVNALTVIAFKTNWPSSTKVSFFTLTNSFLMACVASVVPLSCNEALCKSPHASQKWISRRGKRWNVNKF